MPPLARQRASVLLTYMRSFSRHDLYTGRYTMFISFRMIHAERMARCSRDVYATLML
jgi:hypothetical protein